MKEREDNGATLKNRKRRLFGMRLEFLVARWLVNRFGWGDDVLLDTVGKIDVHVFGLKKVELECKRLRLTSFVTKAWLKKYVVDRYSEDVWLKVLVTTKICWDDDCAAFLKENDVHVLSIGQVDGREQIEEAEENFVDGFMRLYIERMREEEVNVCRERLCR